MLCVSDVTTFMCRVGSAVCDLTLLCLEFVKIRFGSSGECSNAAEKDLSGHEGRVQMTHAA